MTAYRIFVLLSLAGLLLSCDEDKKEIRAVIPVAPNLLAATQTTQNSIRLTWNDRSNDEETFELEMAISGQWHLHTTVNADITTYLVDGLVAATEYQFRIFAMNSAGRSDPSNTLTVSTSGDDPPPPPANVIAEALAPTVVRVGWSDTSPVAVTFVVSRRTAVSAWANVGQVGDNIESYNDSTCADATEYYYRVGAQLGNLLTWSLDSASVTTPTLGAPHAPSELTAIVTVGTGVRISWLDNSLDETEFHIRRNQAGNFWETIDTVAANTVEYFDTLAENVAIYNYQVRANNSFGTSAWSNIAQADYRYCSDGAVPICLSNYWRYEVDPNDGPVYVARREVREVAYPGGIDYYLVVEFVDDTTDTLFYWRNFANGLFQDEFPLGGASGELLLRSPPGSGFWNFEGDSVIVATSNVTVNVNGTTYTGVTIYQRFDRGSNYSIKYYLKPQTIGIIKEEEYVGADLIVRRELMDYEIRN
ncbi:MAG: fibronectin type III domain-containing protein [bacterium]|nr:fibronectin type III domain-containing protein [bacterium]